MQMNVGPPSAARGATLMGCLLSCATTICIAQGSAVPKRQIEKTKLRVWVTEFAGLKDCTTNAQFTGTWLEALYQAQMVIQFLSTASIDPIDLYNITGSTGSLMFQSSSSDWNACKNKSMTFQATNGDLTGTGQAYALLGGALKEAKSAYPVAFPEMPPVHPSSAVPYPSVVGSRPYRGVNPVDSHESISAFSTGLDRISRDDSKWRFFIEARLLPVGNDAAVQRSCSTALVQLW